MTNDSNRSSVVQSRRSPHLSRFNHSALLAEESRDLATARSGVEICFAFLAGYFFYFAFDAHLAMLLIPVEEHRGLRIAQLEF